jgi:hypothetical protein
VRDRPPGATFEISDGEEEKRDVHGAATAAVHVQKGAEQKHRRANRADKICQDAAVEQEGDVCEREGGSRDVQMDCAGNDKECADHNDESRVFAGGMLNAGGTVEGEDLIAARCRGQERT